MIWTIHTAESRAEDEVRVVPENTALWAFLLPSLWLARHRLWLACLASSGMTLVWAGLLTTPYAPAAWVLGLVHSLYVWLEGSQLRRAGLMRLGLSSSGVVEAPDEETALARALLAHETPAQPAPPASAQRLPSLQGRTQPSTLGMFGT